VTKFYIAPQFLRFRSTLGAVTRERCNDTEFLSIS